MLGLQTVHKPSRRDRIVVSTLRCGRSNPGSNPGHGNSAQTGCFTYRRPRHHYTTVDPLFCDNSGDPTTWSTEG